MRPSSLALAVAVAFLVFLLVPGCSKAGFRRAEVATSNIVDTRAEIEEAKKQVTTTMESLDVLVAQKDGDLPTNYQAFCGHVDALEAVAGSVKSLAQDMQARGDDYFNNWQSELESFEDEEIRSRSEKRREELLTNFEETRTAMTAAKEEFEPFMTRLKGLAKYLGTDLTPAGIDSIADLVEKAKESSSAVLGKADELMVSLDNLETQLSPGKKGDAEKEGDAEKDPEKDDPEKPNGE